MTGGYSNNQEKIILEPIIEIREIGLGRKLEIGIMGNLAGSTVYILIPGSGMVIQSFKTLAIKLAQKSLNSKIIIVNPAGHGNSDTLSEAIEGTPYSESYIQLAKQLKKEGADKIIFVGYSKGGCDSIKLVELLNKKAENNIVDGVVSIAGCARFGAEDAVKKMAVTLNPKILLETLPAVFQLCFEGSNTSMDKQQQIISQFVSDNISVPAEEFVRDLQTATNTVTDLSSNEKIPMLLIAFQNDVIVPLANIEETFKSLQEQIKNKSDIKIISNSGHLDLYTYIDVIASYICEFEKL
jgi:pimeloyl-ACP methyl ester carboxylesterase